MRVYYDFTIYKYITIIGILSIFLKCHITCLTHVCRRAINYLCFITIIYIQISANRRSSVAVPGYDSSDHARARVQSAPIEGSHGS